MGRCVAPDARRPRLQRRLARVPNAALGSVGGDRGRERVPRAHPRGVLKREPSATFFADALNERSGCISAVPTLSTPFASSRKSVKSQKKRAGPEAPAQANAKW